MSTKLNSKLTRESSEKVDEREILITLNEDQTVSLKLKGMKSGSVSVGIAELWAMLNNEAAPTKKIATQVIGEQMIPLSRLKSMNWTTPGNIELAQRMDELLSDLIK